MSQDDLKRFIGALETTPELQEELAALLGKSTEGRALSVGQFVALADRHGFAFTEADIAAGQGKGELGMEQLDEVTGGAEEQYFTIQLVNANVASYLGGSTLLNGLKLYRG